MKSTNNGPLFTDLTEDEQAALNGGYFCRYIAVYRRICYGFYCFWQYAYVWRCS